MRMFQFHSYSIVFYLLDQFKARVETMDALDALPDLVTADELKSKLLFSVVVVSCIIFPIEPLNSQI